MTYDKRTVCPCGSTTFKVSERVWRPATIEDGQLVLTNTAGVDGGFETAVCTRCHVAYDVERFNCEHLLDRYES